MEPEIQEQIGRYKISGELGRGAMGVVYRANDPSIGRTVAIKTIRIRDIADTARRDKLRERLFLEARSAGVLSHPNIVTIYDMDEDDGIAYIAMAFVNGPTLEKILSSEESLSGARMLRILRQAASALDYAHGKGIVHRDVKPANIMTDEDGSVKITDFGIARIATAAATANETKTVSGTPNYMSPEQVQGVAVDGRSDQFSLAVVAYEILTGERPFAGEHLSTIVYRIVTEDPPAAHRLNGTLTPRIDEVLRKALSKDPAARFPNCSNFVGALELACAESRGWQTLAAGASAEQPTLAVERPVAADMPPEPRREPRRHSRLLPVLMSVLLVSALGAVFVYQAGMAGRAPESGASVAPAPVAPAPVAPAPEPARQPEPEARLPESKTPEPALPDATATAEAAPSSTPPPGSGDAAPAAPSRTAPAGPVVVAPAVIARPRPSESPAPPSVRARYASPDSPSRIPLGGLQDIWIATNPSGATVVLDENAGLSCLAPCQLHAAPGVHRLAISLPGFLNESREIRVGDTALDVGVITLRQPTGTLMLATSPPGASIRINGERLSQLTPAELPLRPGSYVVTVEKNGVSRTERVDLRESPLYLRIPLPR